MAHFHIHTLGCKVNRAESETIAAALLELGWAETAIPRSADLVIVNTCTVTGEADAKNRKLIRSLLRASSCPVLVTGCAINIDADYYRGIDQRVVCERDKSRIAHVAQQLVRGADERTASAFDELSFAKIRAGSEGSFRTRVDLKIQDGCDNACSFCIVHVARGPAHSAPAKHVVNQARLLAASGVRELVLVGIDLAAYNDGMLDLAGLIGRLQAETEIERIRISSVEPQSVTPSLIELLGNSKGRVCRHLHLCLQSGSNKVLDQMNRRYSAQSFLSLVEQLYQASQTLALSTDVIVGFPGESDSDFEQTCDLIERARFMRLHVFRYSKRPGTPAAARTDQIDARVMAKRSEKLIDLGRRLALEDMRRRIGTSEQVIVERPGLGTSESYHAVSCSKSIEPGTLARLEFTDIDETHQRLMGRLV